MKNQHEQSTISISGVAFCRLASVKLLFWLASASLAVGQTVRTNPPLTSATVREVFRVTTITRAREPKPRIANRGDQLRGDDLLQTENQGSGADLEFDQNHALYRLASGTLFSFSPETGRLHLTKGLGLMSVEDGKVVCETCKYLCTAQSTAILEVFAADGVAGKHKGCATKFILLEGKGTLSTLDGSKSRTLRGGQMIVQYEDERELAEPQAVDVKRLVSESRIVTGFKMPLPSMARIQVVIDRQQHDLWRGSLERTSVTLGGLGPSLYPEANVQPNMEAPYDPGVPEGIKAPIPPCPNCN